MGQETRRTHYSKQEERAFALHLKEETEVLKQWIKEGRFENAPKICGYEAEGWIVNNKALPYPCSDKFLKAVADPHITPELSKFNFEINGQPFKVDHHFSQNLEKDLKFYWEKCSLFAQKLKGQILFIGTYPDITQVPFGLEQIYPRNRYYSINQRIRALRGRLAHVEIKGKDSLSFTAEDIMHEAGTTSLQIHLQADFSQAKDFYNSSLIASPLMIALCANSPYLCGKELWEESRIPLFEQVISLKTEEKNPVSRVGLGWDFVQKCPSELFDQNLKHPVLLPELTNKKKETLSHLLFHNGTIWRWNRPIIGFDKKGLPHFRVEHRAPSAGPTRIDMQANILFFIGLVHLIRENIAHKPLYIAFPKLKEFFYQAAKQGLSAKMQWLDKKTYKIGELIAKKLVPLVWEQLKQLSLDDPLTDRLINEVIKNRALSGQNSSFWQKAFIRKFGKNFDKMIQAYLNNQEKNIPVYQWKI